VDHFSHRDLLLDRIEEADELLVAMALHVAADDGAIETRCRERAPSTTSKGNVRFDSWSVKLRYTAS
jgi:hypothetical protein